MICALNANKLPRAVQKLLHKVNPIIAPIANFGSILVVLKPRRSAVSPDE